MGEHQMGAVEAAFADIIWENEPVSSGELAKLSEQKLKWKKSTTYTVLKRLCTKGIFKNENGCVTSLMSREEFYGACSEQFVDENFGGSLPAFFAAFSGKRRISHEEAEELRRMLDEYEED